MPLKDLVSVIIPVYNTVKDIEHCILSVLNQDYKNIEIILVDDGSNDGSEKQCDLFALKDERVHVYHVPNGGVSKARNIGIQYSQGDYLVFVDSDDCIEKDLVSSLMCGIVENNVGMCVGRMGNDDSQPSAIIKLSAGNEELVAFLLTNYLIFGPCQKIYYRGIIIKERIRFQESVSYGEDLLFNLEYTKYIDAVFYINKRMYYYNRENQNSLSQRKRWDLFENDIHLNEELLRWLKQKNILNSDTQRIVVQRVLDTAYNSVCLGFEKKCPIKERGLFDYYRTICDHYLVKICLPVADTRGYAPWIITAIRYRMIVPLTIISWVLRKSK